MALTPGSRLGPYEVTALLGEGGPPPLPHGGMQLGPYQIVAKLGEGGMGTVYRATDTNLKRPVAIKVLPASVADDAERLARLQREAEVLAALNHPHIAAIYGLEKGRVGQDGRTVRRVREGPSPIAHQIAEALEAGSRCL